MKYLSLFLAALMLLCLAPMLYGLFPLVRFVAMLVFGVMACRFVGDKKLGQAIVFISLALLFQPFFKIALGRTLWNVIDVLVAIGLMVLFLVERRRKI